VAQLAELRTRLREVGTEFTVVKNTLARRAAADSGREALLPFFDGPTGLAWVGGDAALAAKALSGFAGEHRDTMSVKGGLLDGAPIAEEAIGRLARLPTREQLLGQLAGGIAAPLSGLSGRLSGLLGGLVRTLAAVQEQRAAEQPGA
jgi:large subunit ribosomal protein L10